MFDLVGVAKYALVKVLGTVRSFAPRHSATPSLGLTAVIRLLQQMTMNDSVA